MAINFNKPFLITFSMNSFFDVNGLLNLDDTVLEMPSFKKIISDGVVSDEEIMEQSAKVVQLLHKAEQGLSDSQVALVKETLAEMSVLYAAYYYKELQSLK